MFKKYVQLFALLAILAVSLAATTPALAASSVCGGSVTVATGDTLRKIADRCGTTLSALQRANGISNANVIYVGQVLVMPGTVLNGSGTTNVYIVARGDTFKQIAVNFGTTMDVLKAFNPDITNINLIYEGQRINVPSPGSVPPPPPPASGSTYTVQFGDTLRKIATRMGTTTDAILKANPQITNANLIYAGQIISLPAGPLYYTVQRGDTLKIIGTRVGLTVENLLALNPSITNANLIYVGQVLQIR